MKVVIIEDEHYAAEALEKMLLKYRPNAKVLNKISSVDEGLEYFAIHPEPDLIFSDIRLSDGNSFEIFQAHPLKCPVIFTTAYDQYAIQAFEVNSIDYLLKPIKDKELLKTLNKLDNYLSHRNLDYNLIQRFMDKKKYKTRFTGTVGQKMHVVSVKDIVYFKSEDGVVFIYTKSGKRLIVDYTLEQLETYLEPTFFYRANRQLIVHIHSIHKVEPYFKGRLLISLNPALETKQTVSQNKASEFKKWLNGRF